MPEVMETELGVVVSEFPIDEGHVVRAFLHSYRGQPMLSLRKFYSGRDGALRPTRNGLTLGTRNLPQIEDAVRALRAAADAPPVTVES
ncbi:MAG TPA: PC4/YdbC family ssDNA-binding protein [Gemmatimonadaceae bacterium]